MEERVVHCLKLFYSAHTPLKRFRHGLLATKRSLSVHSFKYHSIKADLEHATFSQSGKGELNNAPQVALLYTTVHALPETPGPVNTAVNAEQG
jgi:hypothetical protein